MSDDAVYEDDFHSNYVTDDAWRNNVNYSDFNNEATNTDDEVQYSARQTTWWLDQLLKNTTYASNDLSPAEDVNLDNVLATLAFNSVVCVVLLGLYELLRRLIPSVYSQRLVYENREGGGRGGSAARSNADGATTKASLEDMRVAGGVMNGSSEDESEGGDVGGVAANGGIESSAEKEADEIISPSRQCVDPTDEICKSIYQEEISLTCCKRTCNVPILEWCIPVYKTPWSKFREVAGLDAYMYLRYIRMCLKICAVSSFWAIVILCPVYATGGGEQTGFYHFSMANILQEDKGRVWVPTFFCWAFTFYSFFCVREEMMHYVELRMEFLGAAEEDRTKALVGGSGTGASTPPTNGDCEADERRSNGSMSPLMGRGEGAAVAGSLANSGTSPTRAQVQNQINQHRYSLQIEKIPVELRSNQALFAYFNEMFPGQVHSASVAMNVPDLDALSARRDRVCRRLEKSLAYYEVTGTRPMHIAGRPRFRCCGIESTPLDGWCLACCCYGGHADAVAANGDSIEPYHNLPDKGERVDSILYYTLDLANGNRRMKRLQAEKFMIAETGKSTRHLGEDGVDESNCDWYAEPLGMLKTSAAFAAEGLREQFEVSREEDYFGDGVTGTRDNVGYGSISQSTGTTDKRLPLVQEDHLAQLSDGEGEGDASSVAGCATKKTRYRSRPYIIARAILWRLGFDFLAAWLDEVRNKTDVVVDSVTRPSMSSTGFVTFKTLTPVTVTTSSPLTYNRCPMEVSIAPESRDIVWQNVQIDRDIGASRSFFANVLLGLGVLLWSIPLTLIQAWAKVENVVKIPGLEWVEHIHGGAMKPLINGYLPVVTLLVLILILPLIFQFVATSYERRKTLSGVQNSIVGRYFYYQLANIYITVTAGALWTALANVIDHPQELLVILGQTFPKLAGYFISLLLTKTLAGLPMVLLRVGALSRMMFLRSCFNKKRLTRRELKEVYRKQPVYYGWEYPTQFLVIIIAFTYAIMTPFVLPVAAVYFFVALLVYKKQALYVYSPTYESGGRMFPQAIRKTLFALLISQMTFMGYTLVRKGVFQIIFMAPLPFLTVYFTLLVQHRYMQPSKKLSLERAVKIDKLLDQSPNFSDEAYQQPVLTERSSVPSCETNDDTFKEVIELLDRLENDQIPQTSRIV